jgi:hypothetical protein
MKTRILVTTMIAIALVGCSKSADQPSSTVTGLTPRIERPKSGLRFLKPDPVTIPQGTPVKIRTDSALSTKTANSGDTFTATLTAPLIGGRE